MNPLIIARKEIHQAVRNRWVLASTLLLAALALSLTFLGSAPTGTVGVRALDVVVVSLSSLTIFLIPLIALLISHDAIVGEMERGTMLLLLSYPVARWQVLLGKFLGHVAVLAFATCLGYGAAAAALARHRKPDRLRQPGGLRCDDRLVRAARRSLRRHRLSRQRAGARPGHGRRRLRRLVAAAGADLRHGPARHARASTRAAASRRPCWTRMLLLNPTDVYRLFNLTGFANVSSFAGHGGTCSELNLCRARSAGRPGRPGRCVPLGLAPLAFSRREL